ncbi:TraB/GumN family protein [Variovorax sp. AB1(2024)]|uniref:TraB/GumN family protein n=1 Tax=Variovorax sp. AB1(2024) TaxID=3132214 RepID=UPI0030B4D2E7
MYYDITGANTRILGALHLFPPGVSSLPWWVIDAFNGSELIEMEHDHAEFDAQFIDPNTKAIKPWAALIIKMRQAFAEIGGQPGVESIFSGALQTNARPPMTYLETGRSVADLLDAVPAQDLASVELAMTEARPTMLDTLAATHSAWEACDYAALVKLQAGSPLASMPSLRHAFFDARNESWANTIAARGVSAKRQLLVVGALHLVGPNNLLDRLVRRGLAITHI